MSFSTTKYQTIVRNDIKWYTNHQYIAISANLSANIEIQIFVKLRNDGIFITAFNVRHFALEDNLIDGSWKLQHRNKKKNLNKNILLYNLRHSTTKLRYCTYRFLLICGVFCGMYIAHTKTHVKPKLCNHIALYIPLHFLLLPKANVPAKRIYLQ